MNVPSISRVKVRSFLASLAVGLVLAPGCGSGEGPAPRADQGVAVEPKVPRAESKEIENVERDLRKDLTPPVVKPGGAPTPAAPGAAPGANRPGPP
jgi:hypothetical protein